MTRPRLYLSPPHMGKAERKLLLEAFASNWIAPLGPHVDATPVFVDSDRENWNMDPALLAKELAACGRRGRLPKAVIAVDLYGQCADYGPIQEVCGRFGVMGVYSFNGNKIITTSGGGMLVSDDQKWTDRARHLSTQARDEAPHYQHSESGHNYRMSNLLAAVGRGQLRVLRERVERRREINAHYREALGGLPGVEFIPEAAYGRSNCWLTVIQVEPKEFGATREQIRLALERENIESRPVWKPMHLQPVFKGCRTRGGAVAAEIFEKGLCLPSGTAMTDADLRRVVRVVKECCRSARQARKRGELGELQEYGARQAADRGITEADIEKLVFGGRTGST